MIATGRDESSEDDEWEKPIQELSRFANYLISCTSLATLCRNAATAGEESLVRMKSNLGSLRSALSNLPCMPESFDSVRTEKSADNDKIGDPLVRPKANGEQEEASIRKSTKVLSASWQVQAQVHEIFSSKTD